MRLVQPKSITEATLWIVGGGILATFVLFLDRSPAPLSKILFDGAHVLISFIVGLVLVHLSHPLFGKYFSREWYHYAAAGSGVVIVGGGFEVLQLLTRGDPSYRDLARDAGGGAAALIFVYSVSQSQLPALLATTKKTIGILMSLGLLGLVMYPNLVRLRALLLKRSEFPVLQSCEYSWEHYFCRGSHGATLTIESVPPDFATATGKFVGKVKYGTTSGPALSLDDVVGDWSPFDALKFEVYSLAQKPVEVILSIHDHGPRQTMTDHCNIVLKINPGNNSISIPVQQIRTNPKTREMDVRQIISLVVFRLEPTEPVTLYFDQFRLE